jgi:hypothetical protein
MLIQEYLEIAAHDPENLDRTMKLLSDDCIWIIRPPGIIFHGIEELRPFI